MENMIFLNFWFVLPPLEFTIYCISLKNRKTFDTQCVELYHLAYGKNWID